MAEMIQEITQPAIKKSNTWKYISITLLFLLLLGGVGYFAFDYYNKNIISKELEKANFEGYNRGAIEVINYIYEQSAQCRPIPLNASGNMLTLISVDCLQPRA